jgi:hypothetical protein
MMALKLKWSRQLTVLKFDDIQIISLNIHMALPNDI